MRCQKDKGSHKALIEHYGKFPFEQCTTKLNQLAGILCWSKAKVENCLCEYSSAKIPTDYFFPNQRIWTDESTCYDKFCSDDDVALVIEEMPPDFKPPSGY